MKLPLVCHNFKEYKIFQFQIVHGINAYIQRQRCISQNGGVKSLISNCVAVDDECENVMEKPLSWKRTWQEPGQHLISSHLLSNQTFLFQIQMIPG
jgi:hypothetical protein